MLTHLELFLIAAIEGIVHLAAPLHHYSQQAAAEEVVDMRGGWADPELFL